MMWFLGGAFAANVDGGSATVICVLARDAFRAGGACMKRVRVALIVGLGCAAAPVVWAQDATIIHARIAVGDGPVIQNGYILVRDGRIVMVGPGQPGQTAGTVIDATGMTAVPGLIDGHKHINTGPYEKQQMADLIENGFTTVLSAGGPADGTTALAQHIESGAINGPRVLPSGTFFFSPSPEAARAAIRQMAAQGVKYTGEFPVTPEPSATPQELAVLSAAVDEGKKVGVQVQVHAVSTPAMLAVTTRTGVRHQVHLPNKDFMSFDDARTIVRSGTIVLDLISFGDPIIDVFQQDDTPRFRTGLLWPESIAGANRDDKGRATGTEGAYTLINARRIWDASNGKALGFGSDQNYPVHDVLEHELKSLMVMFSMQDVIRILTLNTANFLGLQNEIGSLEPTKRADIVLVQGNPFRDFHDLLNTMLVLKDGKVVVDKRDSHEVPGQQAEAQAAAATDAEEGGTTATAAQKVGTLTAAVARPDQAPAVSCSQLSDASLSAHRVRHAEEVPASSLPVAASPAGDRQAGTLAVPAYCLVTAALRGARGPAMNVRVWLPASDWNGNLLMLGAESGSDPMAVSAYLAHGYALVTTGTGHPEDHREANRRKRGVRSARVSASAGRGVHESVQAARMLINSYYGGTPRYTYWIEDTADSAGPLEELQANPSDFDGLVVGSASRPGNAAGGQMPDVSAFAARGGKILEYRGGGPVAVPTDGSVRAYEGLVQRTGGLERTARFYRLFLVPPGRKGDSYRVHWVRALDEWVQRGRAPDMLLAAHIAPPNQTVQPPHGLVFEPPYGVHTICAYPKVARAVSGAGQETPVDWLCLSKEQAGPEVEPPAGPPGPPGPAGGAGRPGAPRVARPAGGD
ncbi:MAG TPA: amidohydrolase family protein [Castellaniella sp.]|nr:amidohydrolase family protein [Castellaniella sp.]